MCYASSCDPRCGKCTPKKVVDIACPECGFPNVVSREALLQALSLPHKESVMELKMIERGALEEPVCKNCGADLRAAMRQAIEPAECRRSRIVCAYPCGLRNEPFDSSRRPCQFMVPVARLKAEER